VAPVFSSRQGQLGFARSQISLRQCTAWVGRLVPHGAGALDPDAFVLRQRAALGLGLDGGALEGLEP
jgi:hypothetical protein